MEANVTSPGRAWKSLQRVGNLHSLADLLLYSSTETQQHNREGGELRVRPYRATFNTSPTWSLETLDTYWDLC